MNHIIRTAAVLACAVSLCAAPCTIYAAETATSPIGPGRAASVETNYPDTEEAKQALAILTDLYANETDETMRRIAVDTSLAAICGTDPRNGTVNTTYGMLGIIGGLPEGPVLLLPDCILCLKCVHAVLRIRRASDHSGSRAADPRHHAPGTVL